jgi:hypothetical protein
MRKSSGNNPLKAKEIARRKYAERQIERWIKWSIEQRGFVKYKDIVEIHKKFGIEAYG